jgi:phosphatidylglycerol---prolipoprotein diacylglyceryl transferase
VIASPYDKPPIYTALLLAGLVGSLIYWVRAARRDERLFGVFAGAVLGCFAGAKLVYLVSEGWLDWPEPDRWLRLATGKSVLGALFGGYAGVEWAKWQWRYPFATGDRFALIVPLSLMAGRIGCFLQGCCLGVRCESPHWWTVADATGAPRWPAPFVELLFNAAAAVVLFALRRAGRFPGQHFHLYLIAYGLFRAAHEPLRATPKAFAGASGYQLTALALAAFGAFRFWQRRRGSVVIPPGA